MARMMIVPGPGHNNWGSTLPIKLVPVTTADALFEERAAQWVQLYYPDGGFTTQCRRAWPIPAPAGSRAKYIEPDILTHVYGLDEVVFVGDAKNRASLRSRDVAKVIRYRDLTSAERAAVFVPRACKISKSVQELADANAVDVVLL